MKIPNQRYEFSVGGESPIILIGAQEYSPGQAIKCTEWTFDVPLEHKGRPFDAFAYQSFAQALTAIAKAFFDGDEDKAKANMTERGQHADRS